MAITYEDLTKGRQHYVAMETKEGLGYFKRQDKNPTEIFPEKTGKVFKYIIANPDIPSDDNLILTTNGEIYLNEQDKYSPLPNDIVIPGERVPTLRDLVFAAALQDDRIRQFAERMSNEKGYMAKPITVKHKYGIAKIPTDYPLWKDNALFSRILEGIVEAQSPYRLFVEDMRDEDTNRIPSFISNFRHPIDAELFLRYATYMHEQLADEIYDPTQIIEVAIIKEQMEAELSRKPEKKPLHTLAKSKQEQNISLKQEERMKAFATKSNL